MAELVANFTLSEGVEFDTVFQINATPTKVSQLDNDLNYQTDTQVAESIDEAATTINNRIDDINNTLQGYGNIVTHNVSEFATSAQGALADTALQPNDNITELYNNAGYITDSALEGYATESFVTSQGYITTSSVGKANLTIQRNGTALGTFNANATEPLMVNISVPTTASDLNAVPTSRKINGHTLTADVTLTAADVGALPDSTTIGNANLTIKRNNTAIGSFSANATEAIAIDITVPTTATEVGALPSTTTITDLVSTTQMNAINSGATTTNIGQIATNTSAIATINGKIPSQASSSNQLADKSFVNSSIATNTANFIGTFNSVAELEAYSGTLTNNDYAFVVTTDSAGNTLYDRYKYNGSEWLFEYELNNSSFTASQWTAINSGITSSDVTLIGTALQPNDNISELTNDAGYITSSALSGYATETWVTNKGYITGITSSDVTTALGYTPYNATNPNGYITSSALTPYVLSSSLATVATSGSYNDLSNKPTIPSEVTESTVSGWGFTKNTGTVTSVNNVAPVNGNVTLSIPTVDSALSTTSTNPVQNKVINTALDSKQDVLTAGTDLSINTITSGKNKFDVVTMGTDMNVSLYTDNYISRLANNSGVIVPILPNTTYTVSTATELTVFRIATYPTIISYGDSVRANAYVKQTNNNPITFTSAANDHYLYIQVNTALFSTAITTLQVEEGTTATTYTAYQNTPSTIITFTNDTGYAKDSDVIKKDGGSAQQVISLTSGTGTTALGVKSASTSSSYISFTSASAWLGSIGVNSSKQPVFYNGVGYTLACTSDIPTIATSVSASSTNAETVGAKLFYDTCGDIETLINAL